MRKTVVVADGQTGHDEHFAGVEIQDPARHAITRVALDWRRERLDTGKSRLVIPYPTRQYLITVQK